MKKTAFTLAELIIVMGVIGFIAIIVLSQTNNIIPNENMAMFKKTYSVTTQIVNSMVNDDDLYPEKPDLLGFDNTEAALYKTEEREGNTKFCWLFSEMLNTISDVTCGNTAKTFTAGDSPNADFITADGVAWALPITNFTESEAETVTIKGTEYKVYKIYVDINGENEPNCFATDTKCDCEKNSTQNTDGSRKCNLPEPDRMTIYIAADGETLLPESSVEEFYIKSEKSSAKYHNKKGN